MEATGWSAGAGRGMARRHGFGDAAGLTVLGGCAVWSLVTATARGGRPEGTLLAVLAVAAGYACGRIGGALVPVAASAAAGIGGLCLVAVDPHGVPAPETTAPLGHAGATAALFALSAGALCCAAWSARHRAPRIAWHVAAAGTAVPAAVVGSGAGTVACGGIVLCSLAAAGARRRPAGLVGFGLVTALVAALGAALAKGLLPSGPATTLADRLTPHRVLLWRDALRLAESEPLLGVGPGRFEELSRALPPSTPPDGKPHAALLQVAAEQGIVGAVLLAAAYGWVLYALWCSARPTPVVLAAGAALTAVAAMASVGNALSFTTVTAGVGLLAGIATAEPLTDAPPHDVAAPADVRGGHG
ncbi:O-antigen ligase family protein [Streptomyces sp. NPDC102406]|uniref:O-antigen ligase family protein n=1 Tax=Streptomyces sp. NPDC102406 TaxID=3366171 RepID=UPI003820D41C